MATSKPQDKLVLDCQSFLHYFHHDFAGERVMSLLLDEWDCTEMQKDLAHCFPAPGMACISDEGVPRVEYGACRSNPRPQ